MNFQGVVMNVADLDRSIDFYREVLGFTLLSQEDQLAAVSAPGSNREQVIVLRAIGSSPLRGGRHIGLRAFVLEVESADQLERIATSWRLGTSSSTGATTASGPQSWAATRTGWPSSWPGTPADGNAEDSWKTVDDFLYGIGE